MQQSGRRKYVLFGKLSLWLQAESADIPVIIGKLTSRSFDLCGSWFLSRSQFECNGAPTPRRDGTVAWLVEETWTVQQAMATPSCGITVRSLSLACCRLDGRFKSVTYDGDVDTYKDIATLLASTPKGVMTLTDATGICCFIPALLTASAKKPTMFNRSDTHDFNADTQDQKFAVLTPVQVNLLAFQTGDEFGAASESQQGLSLLASLSAFYPTIDVVHSGWMSKRRERTVHSTTSMMSYWKRRFFVYLTSGDLLYFRDDTLNELQGRVDVRHAPTVRVTGEHITEEKKKESLFKFAKLAAFEREACLVWIATPPSKMFVIKVDDNAENGNPTGRRHELSTSAKQWLSLLLKGHAETKYTQLEKCITHGKYDKSPEIISAVRAGIPDELRGQLWKGLSGAAELQRRTEFKRSIRKTPKTTSIRRIASAQDVMPQGVLTPSGLITLYEECARPIDASASYFPENQMLIARLCALEHHENQVQGSSNLGMRQDRSVSDASSISGRQSDQLVDYIDNIEDLSVEEIEPTKSSRKTPRNTLNQLEKGKMGNYVYPSESLAADWEYAARRRLLISLSRHNMFDVLLPGYFHGYRVALQVDVSVFESLLQNRVPTLYSHLNALQFPVDQLVEKWFLTLFTSSAIPLPTVLRIWDAFFTQGLRILFGVGMALLLQAEEKLFRAKTVKEVEDLLRATERNSVDANVLFAHVFKDDLNISWLTDDQLEKRRHIHRQRVMENVSQKVEHFNEKLSILSQVQDTCNRCTRAAQNFLSKKGSSAGSQVFFEVVSSDEEDEESDNDSIVVALRAFLAHVRTVSEVASDLVANHKRRQSKWLALSSQLTACPLGKAPNLDLHSWLSQVKDGKISGAGHDSCSMSAPSDGIYGNLSVLRKNDSSDMIFDFDDSLSNGNSWECLMDSREDMKLSAPFLSEEFLYAMSSVMKACCAVRLECLTASYRFTWHGGRWIESPIEFPPSQEESSIKQRMARSNSKTAASTSLRRLRTTDDAEISRSTEVLHSSGPKNRNLVKMKSSSAADSALYQPIQAENTPIFTEFGARFMGRGGAGNESWQSYLGSSCFSVLDGSNKKLMNEMATQSKEAERMFHNASDTIMSLFSKFIRLESCIPDWELRERAFIMEDDLRHELAQVNIDIGGSASLRY